MRAALILSFMFVATAAHAEPRPYLEQPTVSFRSLPAVKDRVSVNPKVRFVGGYELVARGTSGLMGLSDIQVFPDGDVLNVETVSDYGAIARFTLKPDGKGGYIDSPLEIDRLHDANGKDFDNKMLADAEDLAWAPVNGTRYVSYEGVQRIMSYTDWRGAGTNLPVSGLPVLPANFGMEGLTYIRQPSGDVLLIGVEGGGFWQCPLASQACTAVASPASAGFLYLLTSLAVVDYNDASRDHEVLALYRYFDPLTGPRNLLRLLKLEDGRLTVVADLLKPQPYDNYEGVAATKMATGYRLFLISDSLKESGKPRLLVYDWQP